MPEIGKAQILLEGSLAELTRRDAEVSDKLKISFAAIEARLAEVTVKASAVDGVQSSIHTVAAKQEQERVDAKVETEKAPSATNFGAALRRHRPPGAARLWRGPRWRLKLEHSRRLYKRLIVVNCC